MITDGWYLVDAELLAAKNPDTFIIPTQEDKLSLEKGDTVKLIFEMDASERKTHNFYTERMWVKITEAQNGAYTGKLQNIPEIIADLNEGDLITFKSQNIAEIL